MIETLVRYRLVNLVPDLVAVGQTVEGIYRDRLNLPASLVSLAGALNKKDYTRGAKNGDVVLVPDLVFSQYTVQEVLNPEDPQFRQQRDVIQRHAPWAEAVEVKGKQVFTVSAYEATVPVASLEDLDRARTALEKLRSGNVLIFLPETEPVPVKPFAPVSMKQFSTFLSDGTAEIGTQGWIGSYLDWTEPPSWADTNAQELPQVVLVDSLIQPHWNLQKAMERASRAFNPPPTEPTANNRVRLRRYDGPADPTAETFSHGTYMAGLLVAGDSPSGLLGLASGADFRWIDSLDIGTRPDRVQAAIRQVTDLYRNQVFVLASGWKRNQNNQQLSDRIERLDALWVVAAGQTEVAPGQPPEPGENIAPRSTNMPAGMGEFRNVVVVTACDECTASNAYLLPDANYSTQNMVHLAAPGRGIASTLPDNRFGAFDGTSPATALVGGLATHMLAKFPEVYDRPAVLKLRLQITSIPWIGPIASEAWAKVSGGVVDVNKALQDPTKDYLRRSGSEMAAREILGWCASDFTFLNRNQEEERVSVRDLLRLVVHDNVWWGFRVKEATEGTVAKIGPLQWTGEQEVLRVMENGQPKNLMLTDTGFDFTELLLHKGLGKVPCH